MNVPLSTVRLDDGTTIGFRPQPDITTYELALAMWFLLATMFQHSVSVEFSQRLPPEVSRHFVRVD